MSAAAPLEGRRILVTRARHQAGRLSDELVRLGAKAIEIPAIEIVPPSTFAPLDEALKEPDRFDWLILTSVNAVKALRDRCAEFGIGLEGLRRWEVAAVGATTLRAMEDWGLQVSLSPREYVAESLVEALGERASGKRVLIVRAAVARDVIPDALRERGAEVAIAEAYRTVIPEESVQKIGELLRGSPPDAATFTSSSTVTNFFRLFRAAGIDERPEGMRAISIGPITSQTLHDFGWEPAAEADPHDIAGLVAATVRALAQDGFSRS